MQQSGNDEIKSMIFVISIVGAVFYAAIVFAFLAAAFLAFCLTILCLFAWEREITIFGFTLAPSEARAFVGRGLAGGFLLPCFVLFCALFLGVRITDDFLLGAALAGYVLGSLGVELWKADTADGAVGAPDLLPPQITPPPAPPAQRLPSSDAKPFRFASWDDEETRR